MPTFTHTHPDPFGATLLWERIVAHLERTLRTGRHTIGLRSYDNCFHGSKAVDALVSYLNTILPKTVQRAQAVVLCEKLLDTGVIESVKGKREFREKGLYRFTFNHFWDSSQSSPLGSYDSDEMVSSLKEPGLPKSKSMELIQSETKDRDVPPVAHPDLRLPIPKGYASDSTVTLSSHRCKKKTKKSSSKISDSRTKLTEFSMLTKQKLQSIAKHLHTDHAKEPVFKVPTQPVRSKPRPAKVKPDLPARSKSQRSTCRLTVPPDVEKTKRRHSHGAQFKDKENSQREPVAAGGYRQGGKRVRRPSRLRERDSSSQNSQNWQQVSSFSVNMSRGPPAILNCSGMNRSHSFSSCGEMYDLAQISDSSFTQSGKWTAYGFV